jgi:hypothetical protein
MRAHPRTSFPVRLSTRVRPLAGLALALAAAAACTCSPSDVGEITNGLTLVDPPGKADEFERTLDLGAVRVATLLKRRLVFRNDGAALVTVTKAELVSATGELILRGQSPLPTLNTAQTWELEIRYFPEDLGDDTADVIVETDSLETPRYVIHVKARGAASEVEVCSTNEANAEICASSEPDGQLVIDLGNVGLEGTATRPLVLKNLGDATMVLGNVGLTPTAGDEFALRPAAPAQLAAGASAALEVTFSPVDGSRREAFVEVLSDDPDEPRTLVKLVAQGIAPALCVKPGVTVDFGEVDTGTTATRTVVLESCGLEPLVLVGGSVFDDLRGEFAATLPAFPLTLAPGETREVPVTYTPENFGDDDGYLTFRTNDPGSSVARVLLRGRGVGCELAAVPSPVSFGQVSTTGRTSRTVQIQNRGVGACVVNRYTAGPAPFSLDRTQPVPETIPPGGITTVVVAFEPRGNGSANGTLVVGGAGGDLTVPLNGSGITPPRCDLQAIPTTLVFANVGTGQTATQNVVLQNFGTDDCFIAEGAITTSNPTSSTAFNASVAGFPPAAIPSGGTTQVPVKFTPTTAGRHTGVLRIKYSDQQIGIPIPGIPTPGQRTLDVSLEGGTLEPRLCLNPVELDYGVVSAGNQKELSFTITSCGAGSLGIRGLTMQAGTSGDFSFTARPTLPQFLPSNGALTVKVLYKPRTDGSDFGFVEVLNNDATQPAAKVRLRANAARVCDKQLACNFERLRFPTMDIGRSASLSLVCTNVGTQDVGVTRAVLGAGTSGEYKVSAGRGAFPRLVQPGQTLRLEVTYVPQDAGTDRGTLRIESDACEPVVVDLEASGRQPTYPRCPPPQVFSPQTKWAWNGGGIESTSKNVGMSPVVINLTDDNGDGRIDEDDVSEVIFTSCKAGECCVKCVVGPGTELKDMDTSGKGMLRAVQGRDGSDLWSVTDRALMLTALSQIAAGDIDGDNLADIVTVKHHFRTGGGQFGMDNKYAVGTLLVFDHLGKVKFESETWTGEKETLEQVGAPTIGDIDGDGQVEIVFERTIFASNGTKLRDLTSSNNTGQGGFATLTDLDGDGVMEIIAGNTAFKSDGSVLWTAPRGLRSGPTMVLNIDSDPGPEVVLRNDSLQLHVLDGLTGAIRTGPVSWPPPPPDADGNTPSICPAATAAADLDGDGSPEFVIPSGDKVMAIRANGQQLWSQPVVDYGGQCGASGAAAFDFEGDGKYEVVYHDLSHMYVFRGTDGTKLYDAPRNSSTLYETPVIADVDNDGHADLVMTNENGIISLPGSNAGVVVLSNVGNNWPATRRVWNQHSYHQSDVNENGSIPRQETASFKTNNNWRAQPPLCRR